MSLLDDARELIGVDPFYDWADGASDPEMVCIVCSRYRKYGHDPDCPWLALPKILLALEAAEALTVAYEEARIIFGAPLGYRFKVLCEQLDKALDA
jgi:hypothetical protein